MVPRDRMKFHLLKKRCWVLYEQNLHGKQNTQFNTPFCPWSNAYVCGYAQLEGHSFVYKVNYRQEGSWIFLIDFHAKFAKQKTEQNTSHNVLEQVRGVPSAWS